MSDHRICALVPCFNHPDTVTGVVDTLRRDMPVIVVDDGSDVQTRRIIDRLSEAIASPGLYPVTVARHPANRGKGAAIVTGLHAARRAGYTHALQVDADAQHDLDAVERFIGISRSNPDVLVLGYPLYDASIPLVRYYGRYLTQVWVWINSLSFAVRDAMCGFRVYPVEAVLDVLERARGNVASRMAFDAEICVRCVLRGIAVINEPVRVVYPADGISHFHLLRDNTEITAMHVRCFLLMIAGVPSRVFRRARDR